MKTRTILALLISLLLAALPAVAGPTTGPATQPAARPTTGPTTRSKAFLTPEQQKFIKLQELTRKSLEYFKTKNYAEAENVINEALKIDPDQPTNIYNLACLKSLTNHPDDALKLLERSAEVGFGDFIHIEQDTDLDSLRKLPRYKALIAAKDKYQKKDADRNLAALKKQLGDKYLYEIDVEAKLIYAANTDMETLSSVKKWLGAQARSQWQQLFEHHPDQYVAIVIPSFDDYRKMVRMPGVEGIYMHGAHMLIARSLGQVMTHEFTHALHAADLDPLGQDHPIWLIEGLASLFEAAQFDGDKLVPHDNFRLWGIQGAYRRKQLIPLEKLVAFKQPEFMSKAMLGYGEASSFMLYLYEHDLLRKFYDTFKANFSKDPTGKAALEEVAEKPIAEIDQDWQKWMNKRTPPAMDTGRDGVYIGIQFAQANDGLKIEQVLGKGPADRAGLLSKDVIVGVDGHDIRDQQTFIPYLKTFKPGNSVKLRVRRGDEYLDVPVVLERRPVPPPTTKPTTKPAVQPTTKPVDLSKREPVGAGGK